MAESLRVLIADDEALHNLALTSQLETLGHHVVAMATSGREAVELARESKPDIAFLPIGDRFTMGPDTAAIAAKWLGVKQVVPMHWGTFPLLTGTPDQLKEHLQGSGIEVLELKPGETAE